MLILSNPAKSDKLPETLSCRGGIDAMFGLFLAARCSMSTFLSKGA